MSSPCSFPPAKRKAAAVCAALALCFALGTLGFSAEISAFTEGSRYSGEYAVTGTVAEKKEYDKISVLLLESVTIGGTKAQGKINATLPASLSASVAVADKVTVFGKLETNTEAFDDYGFRAEEVSGRVRFQIDVSSLTVTGKSKNPFLAVRSRLVETLYAGMDEESAAVTCALLTGNTSGIESGLLENVRRGGIAHIFAVSGLHIGALYAFCLFLFRTTKLSACPRGIKFFLVAALLFFYGGVCGFSPSVIRACVMCIVLYAHMLIGVKSDLLESAGLAALLLLLVRPSFLFEVGFQLSFAACLSIGVLSRPLKRLTFKIFKVKEGPYLGERIKKSVASFVSVSLAAQLGTAPVLLDTFGYISLWSLLLNGVFVPLVGAVFAGLLAIAFVAAMLPLAAAPCCCTCLPCCGRRFCSSFMPSISLFPPYRAGVSGAAPYSITPRFARLRIKSTCRRKLGVCRRCFWRREPFWPSSESIFDKRSSAERQKQVKRFSCVFEEDMV